MQQEGHSRAKIPPNPMGFEDLHLGAGSAPGLPNPQNCHCPHMAGGWGKGSSQLKANEGALGHNGADEEHVGHVGQAILRHIRQVKVEEDSGRALVHGGHQGEDQDQHGPPGQQERRGEQRMVLGPPYRH